MGLKIARYLFSTNDPEDTREYPNHRTFSPQSNRAQIPDIRDGVTTKQPVKNQQPCLTEMMPIPNGHSDTK